MLWWTESRITRNNVHECTCDVRNVNLLLTSPSTYLTTRLLRPVANLLGVLRHSGCISCTLLPQGPTGGSDYICEYNSVVHILKVYNSMTRIWDLLNLTWNYRRS